MVIYSRAADDADNDLEFRLKRSIDIKQKEKEMGKTKAGKKNGNKERASVSRERRLALALRAVLDALEHVELSATEGKTLDDINDAGQDGASTLNELGYGSLVGIPKKLKELNEALAIAVENKDGAAIARIGAEMVKVQAGKDVAEKAKAAEA